MSIKRYFTECGYGCSHGSYEHPEGIWVDFNDHQAEVARLKAEVERLTEIVNSPHPAVAGWVSASKERDALKAENERLRKAGDWMCGLLQFDFVTKEWNAAKEGKPRA